MAKKTYNNMTAGAEWKCLLLFMLPILLSMMLQQLYNTVDGIIVGNYVSSEGLAAVGNCAVLSNIFIMGSAGLANGCGVAISQYFGAEERLQMKKSAGNTLFLLTVLGIVSAALVSVFSGFASARVLHISEETICAEAADYLRIYALGFFFTFIYNAVAAILRSVGDSRAVLWFLLIATLANTGLDALFVIVVPWGVRGAALATVLAQALCAVVSLVYMARRYPDFRFGRKELTPEGKTIGLCLRMGIPGCLQMLIVYSGHLFLQRLVNSFGSDTMAAFVVGTRYDGYCTTPASCMMQAMASFTGQNVGAGRYDRLKKGLRSAVAMDLVITCSVSCCLYVFAPELAVLFGVTGGALSQSVEMMRFLAFCFPIFAVYLPFNGLFQGAGEPQMAVVTSFTALAGRVGLAYILVYCFGGGYASCWHPQGIGWIMAFAIALIHYLRGGWKTKAIITRKDA